MWFHSDIVRILSCESCPKPLSEAPKTHYWLKDMLHAVTRTLAFLNFIVVLLVPRQSDNGCWMMLNISCNISKVIFAFHTPITDLLYQISIKEAPYLIKNNKINCFFQIIVTVVTLYSNMIFGTRRVQTLEAMQTKYCNTYAP